MIPSSGAYLLVHIFIIGFVKFFKYLKQSVFPVLIVLAVIAVLVFWVSQALGVAWLDDDNNASRFQDLIYRCEPHNTEFSQNKVIVRVDDVQAYWIADVQKMIMDELVNRQLPASISVIPIGLAEDKRMTRYLKKHDCHFEYTLHGYDQGKDNGYQAPEFAFLSEEEAGERIDMGLEVLSEITDEAIYTFVPPNNAYSTGTRQALIKRGFRVVSAERGGFFDYNATTYNYSEMQSYTKEEAFNQCRQAWDESDVCVLMVHPQDFITDGVLDEAKYLEFTGLLDMLEQADAEFTTFEDLKNWYHAIPMPAKERNYMTPQEAMEMKADAHKIEGYKYALTTMFWVGEESTDDNGFIPNRKSAWDGDWQESFGGYDDPYDRCGYRPCGFEPRENPFYFALPYNDLDDDGRRKESASLVPWAEEVQTSGSILKNRWIELRYKDNTCYAQWEDAGPFSEDDFDYVFGQSEPVNQEGVGAGLDISPAAWDCLGLTTNRKVNWRFVDEAEVPPGPWKETITISQGYEARSSDNN